MSRLARLAVRRCFVGPRRVPRLSKRNLAVSRLSALCEWLLRQAVVWGCLACFAFYVLVVQNADRTSALYRCFAGDNSQVKIAVAGLFFMALASLAIKLFGVAIQFGAVAGISLPEAPADGQAVEDVIDLQKHLDQAPAAVHNAYLGGRLQNALAFVKQRRSADGLETHLHRLEDADLRRAAHGHAGVRMMAATIVILGVLGTVTGIPAAMSAASTDAASSVDELRHFHLESRKLLARDGIGVDEREILSI